MSSLDDHVEDDRFSLCSLFEELVLQVFIKGFARAQMFPVFVKLAMTVSKTGLF